MVHLSLVHAADPTPSVSLPDSGESETLKNILLSPAPTTIPTETNKFTKDIVDPNKGTLNVGTGPTTKKTETTPSDGAIPNIIPDQPAGTFGTVEQIVNKLFTFGITVAGIVFLIMLFVAGIQYLVGAGNEEQTSQAKSRMIDALVGLIIVLGAWAIGIFVLNQFGVTGAPSPTPVITTKAAPAKNQPAQPAATPPSPASPVPDKTF